MGVEVYHPHHSPSDVRRLEEYCHHYGLIMTGGSDYHGPDLRVARELGSAPVRFDVVA